MLYRVAGGVARWNLHGVRSLLGFNSAAPEYFTQAGGVCSKARAATEIWLMSSESEEATMVGLWHCWLSCFP